jgi:uracil-DNA glycosylase
MAPAVRRNTPGPWHGRVKLPYGPKATWARRSPTSGAGRRPGARVASPSDGAQAGAGRPTGVRVAAVWKRPTPASPYDPSVADAGSWQSASERRDALKEVFAQAQACVRCAELAATRKTVVFGAGNADADLMFVGEAPGASEDEQGLPFVGRAGKLLETLLEEVGSTRAEVFIANVLKCRPPGNRDPQPVEIDNCRAYLLRQVELIQPIVICTLGNFSTKLLRDDPTGITRLHGQPEVRVIGRRAVRLYPIYHPAAALYTPRMLQTLREDFSRLPGLLALGAPEQPPDEPEPDFEEARRAVELAHAADSTDGPDSEASGRRSDADQLGLF